MLTLTVEDDGDGDAASLPRGGLGLRTMRYRARLIGGTLDFATRERGGLVVRCHCPLRTARVS
jgi:two-component system, NarL family, sensor histidine kinase DegS